MRDNYVYEVPKIYFWEPMIPFLEKYQEVEFRECNHLHSLLEECLRELATNVKSSWKGDVNEGEIYIGEIIDPTVYAERTHRYVGFNHDNKQSSFLIFPFEMPIYAGFECEYSPGIYETGRFNDEIIDILKKYAPNVVQMRYIKDRILRINYHQQMIDDHLELIEQAASHAENTRMI